MTTHFIDVEIDLSESPIALPQAIEAELQKRGEPLRWAVADVEGDRVQVEAIVTTKITTETTTETGSELVEA
ncbi:MAG: hypothetical protein EA001_10950 [Oscillatoriales cyanobacterium]|nr:MAG: hypothetical protein EA001_10950 [Oscillatoriales cyanobacterium]